MRPDIYDSFSCKIPAILITMTESSGIYLWYENLMNKDVEFMCAHIFWHNKADPFLDIAFLEFPPVNPMKYHFIENKTSLIFNPKKDWFELDRTDLGVYKPNYQDNTYDWIFALRKDNLTFFNAEGLWSFPTKSIMINQVMHLPFKFTNT